jgi:hypothetical protein
MKTKTAASAAPSTSEPGATKPTRPPHLDPVDGVIRLPNWPDCLADKAVAASIEGAVFEGYEQKSGKRTAIFRVL